MIRQAPKRKFLQSLDPRERKLLLVAIALIAVVIVLIAFLTTQDDDSDTTPSSYASTSHGARAAYLALEESGYHMERWEQPLEELADTADEHTVLILARPYSEDMIATRATIQKILERGGHVLAAGSIAGGLLPDERTTPLKRGVASLCVATPEGFDPLAASGKVHMEHDVAWRMDRPNQYAEYTCDKQAVVVRYAVGKGEAIWWADSTPLENANIARDGDLALLLNSIGQPEGLRVIWDESQHEPPRGLWSYAAGTPVHLLWTQLVLLAILLVFSYSRRSGPLVPDPVVARDAPLEFAHSLGALYDKADATNIAVRIAYHRFRMMLGRAVSSQPNMDEADTVDEVVSVAHARLGRSAALKQEILACAQVRHQLEAMPPRQALSLIQSLSDYEEEMKRGGRTSSRNSAEEERPAAQ